MEILSALDIMQDLDVILLKAAQSHQKAGIVYFDSEGNFLDASPKMAQILTATDLNKHDVQSVDILMAFLKEKRTQFESELDNSYEKNLIDDQILTEGILFSGVIRLYDMVCTVIIQRVEEYGSFALFEDISDQLQLIRQLYNLADHNNESLLSVEQDDSSFEHNHKLIVMGCLARSLSHSFNNIMSIIEGYAWIIQNQAQDVTQVIDYTHHIIEAIKRGSYLTEQIFNFYSTPEKQDALADIGSTIETMKPILELAAGSMNEFSCESKRRCYLKSSVQDVGYILVSLVLFVRSLLADKERVSISIKQDVCRHGDQDNSTEQCRMDVLFQAESQSFSKIVNTDENSDGSKENREPSLYALEKLISKIDGVLDIEQKDKQTLSASILLPLASFASEQDEDTQTEKDAVILVVEKDSHTLKNISVVLEGLRYQMLIAHSAEEAFDAYNNHKSSQIKIIAALINLDDQGLRGLELIQMFENLEEKTNIILMGQVFPERDQAQSSFFDDLPFLSLPIDASLLVQMLKKSAMKEPDQAQNNSYLKQMAGRW